MAALRIGGKRNIIVLGVVGVAILLLLAWLGLLRERRATYEVVLTPEKGIDHPSVLNIETGEMVPIETALLQNVPYVGVVHVGKKRAFGGIWTALTEPEYSYDVSLRVSAVDLEFAPADAGGRLLHDYWADEDDSRWPAISQRRTSSYTWIIMHEDQDRRILFRTFGGTTGVLRIAVLDESSATLRCRIVGKTQSGGGAGGGGGEPCVARWPEGAGVEIVGISRHPSATSEWWAPDGSPLTRPPCLVQKRAFPDQNDTAVYEIAYRFLHLDRDYIHGIKARVPESLGMSPVPPCDEFGHACADFGVQAFLLGKQAQTTAVEFGVATGEWQTILTTREGGEVGQGDLGIIRISPPEEVGRDLAVTLTISRGWLDNYTWRFLAVGSDGSPREVYTVEGRTEAPTFEQYRFKADNRRSDIKEFRVNVCPYRWRRFNNVSLRPTQDFGVRIESPTPQTPVVQSEPKS